MKLYLIVSYLSLYPGLFWCRYLRLPCYIPIELHVHVQLFHVSCSQIAEIGDLTTPRNGDTQASSLSTEPVPSTLDGLQKLVLCKACQFGNLT